MVSFASVARFDETKRVQGAPFENGDEFEDLFREMRKNNKIICTKGFFQGLKLAKQSAASSVFCSKKLTVLRHTTVNCNLKFKIQVKNFNYNK